MPSRSRELSDYEIVRSNRTDQYEWAVTQKRGGWSRWWYFMTKEDAKLFLVDERLGISNPQTKIFIPYHTTNFQG